MPHVYRLILSVASKATGRRIPHVYPTVTPGDKQQRTCRKEGIHTLGPRGTSFRFRLYLIL